MEVVFAWSKAMFCPREDFWNLDLTHSVGQSHDANLRLLSAFRNLPSAKLTMSFTM